MWRKRGRLLQNNHLESKLLALDKDGTVSEENTLNTYLLLMSCDTHRKFR